MQPRFSNTVKTEWLQLHNHRDMRLLEAISFFDAAGLQWFCPGGSIIDGASIPRALWSVYGCPYIGPYRIASVIHDVYCKLKSRPSEDVHRMFYEAMLCAGCERDTAMRMYLAVLMFGPSWDENGKDIHVSQDGIEDFK